MEPSTLSVSPLGSAVPISFTRGTCSRPSFSTITEAFHHHASSHSSALAARDLSVEPPAEITYGELAQRSLRLARRLRNLGVVPGDRVPLITKRGVGMLVGIMSILSCGAQYVPLDGSVVADETLRFVLKQAGGRTALALKSTSHRVKDAGVTNVVVIDDHDDEEVQEHEEFRPTSSPDGGCYVIYTSGTTGTPKGVDITHRNVTNLLCQSPGSLGIAPGSCVGSVLSVSFDMAAWEILGCLANGGTLIMRGSDWSKALKQIDTLICTPSILAKYNPEDFPNLKTVATAGEPSNQRLADLWASHLRYFNCYGPTETTIVNTMQPHLAGQPLSIGKPTPGNTVYILDENLVPVPVGQPGNVWAGGHGVARGYVDLPERTAERFRLDPFSQDGSNMYNTGDLCQWNPDGTLHILGRIDDQVKVKGFRVELDGVVASLNSCPSVDAAAALLIDGQIHAFLSPRHCLVPVVESHLKTRQPYYAMPTKYHHFDALPMTQNGKIDKKALKAMASSPEPVPTTENGAVRVPPPAVLSHSRMDSNASSATQLSSFSDSSDATLVDEHQVDLEKAIPEKRQRKHVRGFRYRALIIYRRLFSLVGLFNITAAIALLLTGISRVWLGNITAINLVTAVLVRQEFVINALYTITCSVPKSWPLAIRSRCAKIFHLGGVHSGAAVSAGAWLLATNIADIACMYGSCSNWGNQSIASKVISWILSAMFVGMIAMAWPSMRKRYHDSFEKTHRFAGWTMLALFWAQVVLANKDSAPAGTSLGEACVKSPAFWLLAVATASVASSWFFLKKVPVEAEKLSDHAVRLHFDYTVPVNGSFTRLSYKPLMEWHSFATIPAPEAVNGRPKGYSLIVSNAGDWTRSTIQEGPTHIWTRGVPTCGVMRIATLFNRVVLIATGSGIGPVLGHIQNPSCATQLIWSTKNPEGTFGKELCQTITERIPNAVIHDTKKQGRPDLVKMGYNLVKSFQAEAVIIIANEKITKKVVYGLETRGVPAYGAIWDS
ncbi:non-ribosomal peptide synthetase [Fusarium albosuccineum]|uniref:Non-ribosomal peptide synthetase n=1 Tax=Fusarium albosuccineum TaxID=1237068 RepID=A0A8H4LAL2_9HYPO|nr:non-ribosomal peptide synthetase [Fusarium albosuccineum]